MRKNFLLGGLFLLVILATVSGLLLFQQHKPTIASAATLATQTCPQVLRSDPHCLTPQDLQMAYGVEPLIKKGWTGKGQTIVVPVSFGSPTLQQDMLVFEKQFALPHVSVTQLSPLGPARNPNDKDKAGWAVETTLDVQMIRSIAPEANVVVLTSPVAETEGTIGLPELRQVEQYAIDHHLGSIISQSWGASEATLKDQASQDELKQWDALFQKATTQQGITFLASSGDTGAANFADLASTTITASPTSSFPADSP